jgi:DNA-binding transcriptional ArsR family regulator
MKEMLAVGKYIQPDDEYVIEDLETLHVISDPLRLRLLAAIIEQPKPVKQIAAELEVDQIKLYYHFKMLEKHQLVKVVEERIISGIVEKVYRARARRLRVSESLLATSPVTEDDSVESMLNYVFDKSRAKLKKGIQESALESSRNAQPQQRYIAQRGSLRLPPDQARQFFERLETLSEEYFEKQNNPPNYGDWYDFVVAMYPVKISAPK